MAGQRPYEDVERGLVALALANGSARHAHRLLGSSGLDIPISTLESWKRTQGERYLSVCARELPRIKQALAERHTALAQLQADLAEKAARRLHSSLDDDELKPNQVGSVMHQANVGAGIHTDKARDLRGEPAVVIEHRSAEEIEAKLRSMGIIEGEAYEVGNALVEKT